MLQKSRRLKGTRASMVVVIKTGFKLVSYLIQNMESNQIPFKTTVLIEDSGEYTLTNNYVLFVWATSYARRTT